MIRGMWHDDNAAERATEPSRVESARTVPCRRVTKTGWAAMGRDKTRRASRSQSVSSLPQGDLCAAVPE
jgi:hypothetical protein